jgi:hypothetical protein
MNIKSLCFSFIALALSGCSTSGSDPAKPVPPSAVTLDDAQIRSALIGYKLNNVSKPSSLSFNADGSEIFKTSGAEPVKEQWKVKDGILCIESPGYPTECVRVKADKSDFWFVNADNGEVLYQYTRSPQ